MVPACRAYGLGLIPYSPLASGALAGSGRRAPGGIAGRRDGRWGQEERTRHAQKLEAFEALCRELGDEPADVAIAWLLANPVVTAPIIGPRTIEQLDGSLRPLAIRLDDAVLKQLDEIFPGPGGEAPEAYAW